MVYGVHHPAAWDRRFFPECRSTNIKTLSRFSKRGHRATECNRVLTLRWIEGEMIAVPEWYVDKEHQKGITDPVPPSFLDRTVTEHLSFRKLGANDQRCSNPAPVQQRTKPCKASTTRKACHDSARPMVRCAREIGLLPTPSGTRY